MFGSTESEHLRLTNGEISLEDFQPLCDHNPLTSQTDRQTTCDRKTALCTKVHRAVKTTGSSHVTYNHSAEINNAAIRETTGLTDLP